MNFFGGLLRKKSFVEIFNEMLLRKKYFRDLQIISLTKSLTKISTENALEYLASGEGFIMDRLRLDILTKIFRRIYNL